MTPYWTNMNPSKKPVNHTVAISSNASKPSVLMMASFASDRTVIDALKGKERL